MTPALRKILFILLGVIILPLTIYAVFEINKLNEDEEILERIYNRQLEAILFSINQYSDDFISNVATDIEHYHYSDFTYEHSEQFASETKPVYFIHLKSVESDHLSSWLIFDEIDTNKWETLIDSIYTHNTPLVNRLIQYKQNGFRKIEPLGNIRLDQMDHSLLLFLIDRDGIQWLCLTAVEPALFTETVLAPKMQEIAREDFVVFVRQTGSPNFVYSTDSLVNDEISTRPLWLLPDFEIGISPKGKTIGEIVSDRANTSLILIIGLAILTLLGFWLVFYNIRKEMKLAQNKSDFVSNVSHEIRTPLSLISMFAETLLLNRVKNDEKKRTYYEIIHKETARLGRIVNRILDFSQIEARKKSYARNSVKINDIVKEVTDTYSFHLENKGFEYHVKLGDQLPDIQGDREAMAEAVINLIDNGIKYSNNTKKLEIETGNNGDHIFIAVKDHGIGIESDMKKQIFEKFYRITKKEVHDTKGVGLGLSLVKHIMDAHNGNIEVTSEPGKGSTFKLLFPINILN